MRENERSARPPSARKRPASAAPRSAIPSTWSEKTTRRTNTRIKRKGAKAVSFDFTFTLKGSSRQREIEREIERGMWDARGVTTCVVVSQTQKGSTKEEEEEEKRTRCAKEKRATHTTKATRERRETLINTRTHKREIDLAHVWYNTPQPKPLKTRNCFFFFFSCCVCGSYYFFGLSRQ